MSGASFYSGQVVDTPTAVEFTTLALERVSKEELSEIAGLLDAKATAFQAILDPTRIGSMSEVEARALLRSVFAARRRHRVILDSLTLDGFVGLTANLIGGDGEPGERLLQFHNAIANIGRDVHPQVGFDLGSSLLHFSDPDRYWLWTRWMWDPDAETGSLPLIVTEEVDLVGGNIAETYRRIGIAIAFINDVGEAAGFRPQGHGVFDTDVFLATVYAIYMYTTLRMRMTQEFNQVVPELPELLRRLLGVHRSPLLEEQPA
ncbi:MAG: hypothetical protein OEM97_06130 [Acidimicrobiia bacterium]|nr:hypothetical protein [Acidimicrobiia bacterium]